MEIRKQFLSILLPAFLPRFQYMSHLVTFSIVRRMHILLFIVRTFSLKVLKEARVFYAKY